MRYLLNIINLILIGIILTFLISISVFFYYGKDLPDFKILTTYEPPVVSKIFASDGNFLEEYSRENRVFSKYENIPDELINSFIVAEDRNFFSHKGFDLKGILRAFIKNVYNVFDNKRPQGASTITQQVAKNILLSGEISYSRKIKEIILSMRIERILTKEKILELYLNEIYLGNRSYGIASAASNYFDKDLTELSISEMAMLAALPKAPSTYNPYRNSNKALKRRNWVLSRLYDEHFITFQEYEDSLNDELILYTKKKIFKKKASFFKEAIRREIIKQYDEKKLYDQGLSIMSTLNTNFQITAEEVFKDGIENYDKKTAWRGPIKKFDSTIGWKEKLKKIIKPEGIYDKKIAVVLAIKNDFLEIGLEDNSTSKLYKENLKIIREILNKEVKDFFSVGDIIVLEHNKKTNYYSLTQIPDVNGGLVVIDNNSGRILAMVGGFDSSSAFNRVTQAFRQPGSAFKPIVYLSALENDFTPISKILDAPVVIENPSNYTKWRPKNYGNKFYGESTLRLGIEKSRNLMTVRLAQLIGLEKIKELSEDFGIYDDLPVLLSSSLGSVETSLLKLTLAYSVIANGGYLTESTLIDKIQDRNGNVIFRHDKRKCKNCILNFDEYVDENLMKVKKMPSIIENRKRIISPESSYQMTSMLMGVLKRGTAKSINYLDFQVAGKTGTTNNNQDAWFIGFNSEITVGVYVGFDSPKTLGATQTGSNVAAPIFGEFMRNIYKNKKPNPFAVPNGIKFINIDVKSGKPSNKEFIQEAFKNSFKFDKTFPEKEKNNFKGFY